MNTHASPRREDYAKRKRNKRLTVFGIIIFILLFLFGVAVYVSRLETFQINKVELSGGVLVTQDEVEKETLMFLQGNYFWLFPHHNSFLYPHADLERDLKIHFKRIDTISIHLKDFRTLSIQITERKPDALWCDTLPDIGPSDHCYFMDNNSTLFAEAPQFSGDAYFKYYGLVATGTPIGVEYMASSSQFDDIQNFIEDTRRISLDPQYLIAGDNGQFTLVLSSGTKIYFDTRDTLSKISDNLEALLRTPAFATSTPNNLPVDYIDMRFGNKLFYKWKQ